MLLFENHFSWVFWVFLWVSLVKLETVTASFLVIRPMRSVLCFEASAKTSENGKIKVRT